LFRLGRALKVWNIDELAHKMPSKLLTEWIAFFSLENEESEKRNLERKAEMGVQQIKPHRRIKRGR